VAYVLLNYQPYLHSLHITIQTSKVCVSNSYEAGCCWTTHGYTISIVLSTGGRGGGEGSPPNTPASPPKFLPIIELNRVKFCVIDGRGLVGPAISLHHAMGI